ncbi:disintegrin and metalloproteinase domain-containing protein 9-like [Cyrtonyx montezumae]|uniref:disintegrin and metalloproteinase domain-containing protein 9-like n=1 Tax=Cyrtonyx montezumae TaxID=9017 RepID=UPI0032DB8973
MQLCFLQDVLFTSCIFCSEPFSELYTKQNKTKKPKISRNYIERERLQEREASRLQTQGHEKLPTPVPNAEPLRGFSGASRVIYSEVTVPRQRELRHGAATQGAVDYLLWAEGSYHVVHLTRAKNLVANDLPVHTYGARGELITKFPYIQDDCFYEGFVEGSPGSTVALSTCSGIRGVLQLGELLYEVEPEQSSSTFQHLICRTAPAERSVPPRPLPHERPTQDGDRTNGSWETLLVGQLGDLWGLLVAPRGRNTSLVPFQFKANRHNKTLMLPLFVSISNILNAVYKPMGLRIVPSAVEMWTTKDQVLATRSPARTLISFSSWCQKDAAARLLGEHYEEWGFTWKGMVCQPNSVGIVPFSGQDAVQDVMTLAHMIGHGLGFNHDDGTQLQHRSCDCNCPHRGCIMGSPPGSCLAVSNCSLKEYYEEVISKNKPCLPNIPSLKPSLFKLCGNRVLERGEGCDCGNDEPLGYAAHRAPLSCFRDVNVRGDRCGNRGWNGTHCTKCQQGDATIRSRHQSVHPDRTSGKTLLVKDIATQTVCIQTPSIPPGLGRVSEEGASRAGMWGALYRLAQLLGFCSKQMTPEICINRTCVSAAFLDSDCTANQCHGRGVCNNKKNCHCDFGWAPPDCRAEGFGGSVDSSPPPSYCGERVYGAAVKAVRMLLVLILISGVLLYKRADIAERTGGEPGRA